VGNVVTLRWNAPQSGLVPTGYLLEGGIAPGQVLASFNTGSPSPNYTFIAPTGTFYVRIHALSGGSRSEASNEVRTVVNVPAVPSAPANDLGLVNGSSVTLAWRNTFDGGAPSSLRLEATGAIVASLPLGLTDTATFSGVPAGTYTFAVRATNAAGAERELGSGGHRGRAHRLRFECQRPHQRDDSDDESLDRRRRPCGHVHPQPRRNERLRHKRGYVNTSGGGVIRLP
jgi:hypothetical protein